MTAIPESIEAELLARERKQLLRLVVIGSVDDGKSTLIGRLLYETDSIYDDQVEAVRLATRNGDPIDFSLFTDGLLAEREQGITIDVAYRYLETRERRFILADTPGHAQYTRNMATGASTADAAIIVLDARLGVLPQTRRHAAIAALLGIRSLAVAVNKMDLVGFDEAIFRRISGELGEFAARLGFRKLAFFPMSARFGDNLARSSARTPWHQEGTVLGFLESVDASGGLEAAPFRFPVQTVLRPNLDYRGLAGQIASGSVVVGDEVIALPSGARSTVRAIDTLDGGLSHAFAPQSVVIRLSSEIDVGRGEILAHPHAAPSVRSRLQATAVWLSPRPLDPGRAFLLKQATRTVPAHVEAVRAVIDPETLAETPAASLALNDVGRIVVRCARQVACDAYSDNRRTGAFILVDALSNETAAAGMIEEQAPAEQRRDGALVLVVGSAGRAHEIERLLWEEGRLTAMVARVEAALACAAAGVQPVLVTADLPVACEALRAAGANPVIR